MKSITSDEARDTSNQQAISHDLEEKESPEKKLESDSALSTIISALSNKSTNKPEISSLIDKMKALFNEIENQEPGFASDFLNSIIPSHQSNELRESSISLQIMSDQEVESQQLPIDDKEALEQDAKTINSSIGVYLMKRWREKCDHHFLKNVVLEK